MRCKLWQTETQTQATTGRHTRRQIDLCAEEVHTETTPSKRITSNPQRTRTTKVMSSWTQRITFVSPLSLSLPSPSLQWRSFWNPNPRVMLFSSLSVRGFPSLLNCPTCPSAEPVLWEKMLTKVRLMAPAINHQTHTGEWRGERSAAPWKIHERGTCRAAEGSVPLKAQRG